MSKYQIEKVNHTNIYTNHSCCVIDYHSYTDTVAQINYAHKRSAVKYKIPKSVGMWRIKSLKNKNN